ncbi:MULTISPECIES: hypothetical protein [Bacillus]|uniref:hypothetical protein n=1 Tax=Bacillus TaxID=1386 RepID=UPI0011A16A4D|nr:MULTISPECIES: hypothetical protein [Bacillus]MDN5390108.1 hypothetical protein [Bacillus sp. LB7]TWL46211.1 hypothetical protein CHCC15543_4482 [Bacillus licheniformis]
MKTQKPFKFKVGQEVVWTVNDGLVRKIDLRKVEDGVNWYRLQGDEFNTWIPESSLREAAG